MNDKNEEIKIINNMNKFQKVTKNHPPQGVINKIRAELSAPDFPNKNIGLGENPTAEEKFKYEICQSIARYKRVNKLSSQEVIVRIEVSQDQLNDILYGRISHFSLNELVNYLEKLHVPFQVSINNEETASKSV